MLQMRDGAFHLEEKLFSHFAREAVTNQDALDDEVLPVGRHGIGGNEPAVLAQAIGYIIKRERRGCGVFQLPAKSGDSASSVIDDFKWAERCDLDGEFSSDSRAL